MRRAGEFQARLEEAGDLLERYVDDVESGDFSPEDLAVTSTVWKRLEDYTQFNFKAAALRRYRDLGVEKGPRAKVRFVCGMPILGEGTGRAS